jgi:hypothetical protein
MKTGCNGIVVNNMAFFKPSGTGALQRHVHGFYLLPKFINLAW